MTKATMRTLSQPPIESPRSYRWTVAEFHKLAETGIFTEDDRIELIEGELIEMAPIGSTHASLVKRLNHRFITLLGNKVIVSVQDPIALGEGSEPQPDIALLHWRNDFYEAANPGPEDVLLIIEVADTTADHDREIKVPLYARYGIPEVWIIDLQKPRVETYRKLVEGEYSQIHHYREGQIAPELLPEAVIELKGLFRYEKG